LRIVPVHYVELVKVETALAVCSVDLSLFDLPAADYVMSLSITNSWARRLLPAWWGWGRGESLVYNIDLSVAVPLLISLRYVYSYVLAFCGLVVRVLGYRSGGPGSIPGTTSKKKK
jgi:hypothetical protein